MAWDSGGRPRPFPTDATRRIADDQRDGENDQSENDRHGSDIWLY